jgi:hypothetical protein
MVMLRLCAPSRAMTPLIPIPQLEQGTARARRRVDGSGPPAPVRCVRQAASQTASRMAATRTLCHVADDCVGCGSAPAMTFLNEQGPLCDVCVDERISAATGWPRLPAPPPPRTVTGPDGRDHRLRFRLWRTPRRDQRRRDRAETRRRRPGGILPQYLRRPRRRPRRSARRARPAGPVRDRPGLSRTRRLVRVAGDRHASRRTPPRRPGRRTRRHRRRAPDHLDGLRPDDRLLRRLVVSDDLRRGRRPGNDGTA